MSKQSSSAWLLDGFKIGDIFFASPTQQFRARHGAGTLSAYAPATSDTIKALFDQADKQGNQDAILFGLVPFDARNPASLTIPAQYQQAPVPPRAAPQQAASTTGDTSRPKAIDRQPVPAPEVYGDMVRRALELFAQGDVKKIVLSRAMDVTLDRPVDYEKLLPDLLARNAHGYTFAIPAWGIAGQADAADTATPAGTMVGASPELLVRREGARIFVNPLAGSIGRHPDPEIDRARKEGLAISEKDLREHSYVVSDIVRILRSYCDELDVPDGPSVIGTDALWHLSTYITGTLRDPQVTALDLSCALHPTPAICGHPTDRAFQHIRELEPFERGYFAGLVGWQRANGDGEWALTLRCALQTGDRSLRLYAGAGTVAGSDPQSEITETATKMETFMRAIS
ncbi:isochorismate synthase [Bordetella sp. 15P40C-2]|uniref:isochorismate synthase n=1 Tax=Bordetella sp. 15P40C-2 TaxID=2572246 RepID=UPI001325BC15|nr:isochorismate synthase [Bordetella sp. 15P40C-2]MVW73540.1 isochorismate synthase [Bordetella sp. 15P40C-2]